MAEGYKNPTNDPRGLVSRYLPTPYRDTDTSNDVHKAVLTAIQKVYTESEADIRESKKQSFLDTATGSFLDVWGNFIGIPRKEGQSNEDYRDYLKDWITAKKGTIEGIVDGIHRDLGKDIDVSIYEPWRNIFYTNKSLLDGTDYLQGDYYQYAVIDIKINKNIPEEELRKVIGRYKSAGVILYITYSPTTEGTGGVYDLTLHPESFFKLIEDATYPKMRPQRFTLGQPANENTDSTLFNTDKSDLDSKDVLAGDPFLNKSTYNYAGLIDDISTLGTNATLEELTETMFEFSQDIYPALNAIDGVTFTIKGTSDTFSQNTLAGMLTRELDVQKVGKNILTNSTQLVSDDSKYREVLDVIHNNIYFEKDKRGAGYSGRLPEDTVEELADYGTLANKATRSVKVKVKDDDLNLVYQPAKSPEHKIEPITPQASSSEQTKRLFKVSELAEHLVNLLKLTADTDSMEIEYSYDRSEIVNDKYKQFVESSIDKLDFHITQSNGILANSIELYGLDVPSLKLINDALKAIYFTIRDKNNVIGWVKPPEDDERYIAFSSGFIFNWAEYYNRKPEIGSVQTETQYIKIATISSPYGFNTSGKVIILDDLGNEIQSSGSWIKMGDTDLNIPGTQPISMPDISSESYIYKLDKKYAVRGIRINSNFREPIDVRVSVSADGTNYMVSGYTNYQTSGFIPVDSFTSTKSKPTWIETRTSDVKFKVTDMLTKGDPVQSFMYNFTTGKWTPMFAINVNKTIVIQEEIINKLSDFISEKGFSVYKIFGDKGDLVLDYMAFEFNEVVPTV